MTCLLRWLLPCVLVACAVVPVAAEGLSGDYLEARTCDVYTGPCFANAETGLTGNSALMAWSIEAGRFSGIDLSGLKVVAAVRANQTLGNIAVDPPRGLKAVIIADARADSAQREALVEFVRRQFKASPLDVVRVETAPIDMHVDHVAMVGRLRAGSSVQVVTRHVRKGDCVCSNEIVFYPPLATVDNFAPAVVVEGGYQGSGLSGRWNNVNTRSAFLATFEL